MKIRIAYKCGSGIPRRIIREFNDYNHNLLCRARREDGTPVLELRDTDDLDSAPVHVWEYDDEILEYEEIDGKPNKDRAVLTYVVKP